MTTKLVETDNFLPDEAGLGVIIVGYPKSGNTWFTRLVANAIDCPVAGFWNAPSHNELAIEGGQRKSVHRVYKSHHTAKTFSGLPAKYRLIYLTRDPRDVAVSGASYFNLNLFKEKNHRLSHYDKYETMVDVLINGGVYSHCAKPWREHVTEFIGQPKRLGSPIRVSPTAPLIVKYEDLLIEPTQQLKRVFAYLDLEWQASHVQDAIEN